MDLPFPPPPSAPLPFSSSSSVVPIFIGPEEPRTLSRIKQYGFTHMSCEGTFNNYFHNDTPRSPFGFPHHSIWNGDSKRGTWHFSSPYTPPPLSRGGSKLSLLFRTIILFRRVLIFTREIDSCSCTRGEQARESFAASRVLGR